jgi:hypothetical protein
MHSRYSGEFIESRSPQQTAPAKMVVKRSICINRYNNGMKLLDATTVASRRQNIRSNNKWEGESKKWENGQNQ